MTNVVRNLSVVGLSDIETTVVKATYDDDEKPKQKHVDTLVRTSLRSPNMDLMALFRARLAEKSWNIVLKTLIVIHRLMNEGSEGFLRIVSEKPLELNTMSFHDRKNSLAWAMTRLIHVYGDYMCEKATVFKNIQFSGERVPAKESSKFFMELSLPKLVIVMPHIQMQLDKLLCCTPYTEDDQPHPIAQQASSLFIRDAFRLYSLTTVQILLLIDKFLKMNKKEATTALECTKIYVTHSDKFKKWTDTLIRLKMIDPSVLPKFDNVPAGFVELLAAHIKHCDEETATSLDELVGDDVPDKKTAAAKSTKDAKSAPKNTKTAAAAAPAPAKAPKRAVQKQPEPEPEPEDDPQPEPEDDTADQPAAVEDPFADDPFAAAAPAKKPAAAAPKPKPKAAAAAPAAKPKAAAKPAPAAGPLDDIFGGLSVSVKPTATAAPAASSQSEDVDLSAFMASPKKPAAAAARPQPVAAAVADPFASPASAAANVDDPFGDMSSYAANAVAVASNTHSKPAAKPAADIADPFAIFNA